MKGQKSDKTLQHGRSHQVSKEAAKKNADEFGKWTYLDARKAGKDSIRKALRLKDWEAECVALALDAYYKGELKCTDSTEMVAPTGRDYSASHFGNGHGSKCQSCMLCKM